MTIGGTLAKARSDAGLSVAEVSQRTRIRETIIRGIEQDDYSACGGDFYARGHVRSIARAVGADAATLVEEYDATVRAPEEITAAEALAPLLPIGTGREPRPAGSRDPLLPFKSGDGRRPAHKRGAHRPNVAVLLAVALLAAVAVIGFRLVTGGSGGAPAAGPARARPHAAQGAHPRPTTSGSAASPAPPAVALVPVSAVAFGPGGTHSGDNPQNASLALAGHPATPWHTSWYATARFGNLKAGTGLLLDMGRPVTVTSAQITLGRAPGADIELRAGNVPALADLPAVARAANAGGVVQLRPAGPVRGRYLLIWFTVLPPDNSGTYQADISDVVLRGQA